VLARYFDLGRLGSDEQRDANPRLLERGNPGRERGLLSGGIEPAFVNDFRDKANGKRALGIDKTSGENQFGSDGDADQARQEIAGADVATAEPEFDEGAVHPRGFCGDANVGGERQRKTAAGCGPLDQRDDRLRAAAHQHHDVGDPAL